MSKKEENKKTVNEKETPETAAEETAQEELSPLEQLEEQLAQAKDSMLRTAAEYANYRARSAKEKEQTFSNAKSTVVAELLPVIDNLERALNAENSDYEALQKGVEMTLDGLKSAFEKLGVEAYGAAGDTFDPNLHNAVMHIEDEALEANVVAEVFQKGYRIEERVIRPAMVKTAN